LSEILRYNLRTVRAYLHREELQRLWEYRSAWWAGAFLDEWTGRVMRSRLEPMKKIARSIRNHRPLILNWFQAREQVSAGAVEGFNNKVKLVTRKSYVFRTARVAKLALLHNLAWSAPRKLVQSKWESPGRVSPGGTHEKAKERRRGRAINA
jgi:transposase